MSSIFIASLMIHQFLLEMNVSISVSVSPSAFIPMTSLLSKWEWMQSNNITTTTTPFARNQTYGPSHTRTMCVTVLCLLLFCSFPCCFECLMEYMCVLYCLTSPQLLVRHIHSFLRILIVTHYFSKLAFAHRIICILPFIILFLFFVYLTIILAFVLLCAIICLGTFV